MVSCAEFLDARTGELLDLFRARGRPTTVVVCSDHGECLGEEGLYGHAFYHEKVMEVPLLIFRLNARPHPAPGATADG
jgi:arylsulfatase A-like enzyme